MKKTRRESTKVFNYKIDGKHIVLNINNPNAYVVVKVDGIMKMSVSLVRGNAIKTFLEMFTRLDVSE